jgi:hypothetical protein
MLYDMDIAQRDRLQDGLRYQTSELRGEISTAREALEKQLLSVETNLANQIAILGSESWARDDHLRDDVRTLGRTSKNYLMQAFIYVSVHFQILELCSAEADRFYDYVQAAGGLSLLGASVLFLPLKGYLEAGAAATQPPKTLNASILPTPATTQPLAKEN